MRVGMSFDLRKRMVCHRIHFKGKRQGVWGGGDAQKRKRKDLFMSDA